jgi:hypothetical protein
MFGCCFLPDCFAVHRIIKIIFAHPEFSSHLKISLGYCYILRGFPVCILCIHLSNIPTPSQLPWFYPSEKNYPIHRIPFMHLPSFLTLSNPSSFLDALFLNAWSSFYPQLIIKYDENNCLMWMYICIIYVQGFFPMHMSDSNLMLSFSVRVETACTGRCVTDKFAGMYQLFASMHTHSYWLQTEICTYCGL